MTCTDIVLQANLLLPTYPLVVNRLHVTSLTLKAPRLSSLLVVWYRTSLSLGLICMYLFYQRFYLRILPNAL